jgi:hypothetical protein
MIDLAMPRDIDPAVCKLDGVYLYDLDSLQGIAQRTLTLRQQESEKCHQLIEHRIQDFQLRIERTTHRLSPSTWSCPKQGLPVRWLQASVRGDRCPLNPGAATAGSLALGNRLARYLRR